MCPARPDLDRRLVGVSPWLVVMLLAVYWLMAVTAVRHKSATFDELAHLSAGYSYWLTNDYRLHPENGNLPQRWAALPLTLMNLRPGPDESPAWRESNVWAIGWNLLYASGNDADRMLLAGRAAIAVLGVGLGLLVFVWSRRLFGVAGGLLSLVLFAFSPTMLAHGSLATSDMAAAVFFPAAVGALWMLMHRVTPGRVLLAGLTVGGLCLCKMSAPLLAPMALALLVLRVAWGRPLTIRLFGRRGAIRDRLRMTAALTAALAVACVLAWACIWTAYGWRYAAMRQADPQAHLAQPWEWILERPGLLTTAVGQAREWHILPEAWLYGFGYAMRMAGARSAFLNGDYSVEGWPVFFPYTLLVKTPLAVFAVLVLAALAAGRRWGRGGGALLGRRVWRGFYRTAPLWVFLAAYWLAAVTSHLNIGHRHILPTYPAMFILAGTAAGLLAWRKWIMPAALGLALLAMVGESLWIRPHYLAYFNQLVGGPARGHRHLVDSSLDWGQDLPGLKRWLAERDLDRPDAPVYLSYFGSASVRHHGIQATLLPSYFEQADPLSLPPLGSGVYCISATMLQCVYLPAAPGPLWDAHRESFYRQAIGPINQFVAADRDARQALVQQQGEDYWRLMIQDFRQLRLARLCAFLRQREPDDHVGYSILIYALSPQDLAQALGAPAEGPMPPTTHKSP